MLSGTEQYRAEFCMKFIKKKAYSYLALPSGTGQYRPVPGGTGQYLVRAESTGRFYGLSMSMSQVGNMVFYK